MDINAKNVLAISLHGDLASSQGRVGNTDALSIRLPLGFFDEGKLTIHQNDLFLSRSCTT